MTILLLYFVYIVILLNEFLLNGIRAVDNELMTLQRAFGWAARRVHWQTHDCARGHVSGERRLVFCGLVNQAASSLVGCDQISSWLSDIFNALTWSNKKQHVARISPCRERASTESTLARARTHRYLPSLHSGALKCARSRLCILCTYRNTRAFCVYSN